MRSPRDSRFESVAPRLEFSKPSVSAGGFLLAVGGVGLSSETGLPRLDRFGGLLHSSSPSFKVYNPSFLS